LKSSHENDLAESACPYASPPCKVHSTDAMKEQREQRTSVDLLSVFRRHLNAGVLVAQMCSLDILQRQKVKLSWLVHIKNQNY